MLFFFGGTTKCMMKYFYTFILLLVVFDVFSQRTVSGTVGTANEMLPGTSIHEIGTTNGILSIDGTFHIVTKNDTCSLAFEFFGFVTKVIKITQDTVVTVVFDEYEKYDCCDVIWLYNKKRLSAGVKYDVVNSMFGLTFSNGYDERPLIHFEDFRHNFIGQINVQTDFHKDYSFGVNLDWTGLGFMGISAGYSQYHYPSKDFFHRDDYISVWSVFFHTRFILNLGYQTLNDFNNWGASLGARKILLYNHNSYAGLYAGLSAGYYFDYFTYSLYLQGKGYIHENISFRLAYDRIDNHDFFNIGLSFMWRYKDCRCK